MKKGPRPKERGFYRYMENTDLKHIAIILDGNGRYAKEHGLLRQQGHKAGADNVETIGDAMIEMGIPYLTVYAFSTENWKRSEDEVSYLMMLMKGYLTKNKVDALKKGIRIRIIGDRSRFSDEMRRLMDEIEVDTADMKNLNLTLAINYGGRDELRRVVKNLTEEVAAGTLSPDEVTEELISSRMDTRDIPDPDLMIRTSGEERISNFLLWQIAYSELYFTDKYWPEFTPDDLRKAVESYKGRSRRFGGRNENQ